MLIRALRPTVGIEEMRLRRPHGALCAGPGRLCQALGVEMADNGKCFAGGALRLRPSAVAVAKVLTGPRIGISRAKDLPWRFGLAGEAGLSRPFPR